MPVDEGIPVDMIICRGLSCVTVLVCGYDRPVEGGGIYGDSGGRECEEREEEEAIGHSQFLKGLDCGRQKASHSLAPQFWLVATARFIAIGSSMMVIKGGCH